MSYRDVPAALARIERLEAENDDLRALVARSSVDWLNVYVFGVVVTGLTSAIVVTSWLVNAT